MSPRAKRAAVDEELEDLGDPEPSGPAWDGKPPRTLEALIAFSAGMLDAARRREVDADTLKAISASVNQHRQLLDLQIAVAEAKRLRELGDAKKGGAHAGAVPPEVLARVRDILEKRQG